MPVPRFASWDALNADLARQCRARRGRRLRRHTETIGERFARDREALLPLPPVPYDACDTRTTRVTSLSLVRYRRNDYSVPTAYGHREVVVKGSVDDVVIVCGSEEIARHRRSYGREELIFATTWRCWSAKSERSTKRRPWPGGRCRRRFSGCGGSWRRGWASRARASMCRCCGCSRTFRLDHVSGAVTDALRLGVIGFDAVKHLVLCRIEHRPARPRSGAVSASAGRARGHDRGRELPGAVGGGRRVMAKATLLLEAHLKALRLPTFLREYDKVARQCAQEGLDCPRYLFRLCELERLDREQRATERRIKAAKFPVLKSLETFAFRAIPSLNKRLVLELARSRVSRPERERVGVWGTPARARRIWRWRWGWRPVRKAIGCASPLPPRWSTNSSRPGMTSACCACRSNSPSRIC